MKTSHENKMLPSDWNKDQRKEWMIEKYCTCMWALVTGDEENTRVMTHLDDDCPLHGSNPQHELPEGI